MQASFTLNGQAHAQDVSDTFSLFGRRGDSADRRTNEMLKTYETAPAATSIRCMLVMS